MVLSVDRCVRDRADHSAALSQSQKSHTMPIMPVRCAINNCFYQRLRSVYTKTTCKSISIHYEKCGLKGSDLHKMCCLVVVVVGAGATAIAITFFWKKKWKKYSLLELYAHADESVIVWNSRLRDTNSDWIKHTKMNEKDTQVLVLCD